GARVEGRHVPEAHDGEARQLRLSLGYFSGPLHWHDGDRHPSQELILSKMRTVVSFISTAARTSGVEA
ncbi:unnamed protein product, partial [Ascophyllum nodosum]